MLTSTRQSRNMQVLLNVEQADEQATVTVIIGKPIASPPISTEMLTVILENSSGELLKPQQSQPDSGILPESHSRGATASARFTFDVERSVKLKRAILFLRGQSTEFKLC